MEEKDKEEKIIQEPTQEPKMDQASDGSKIEAPVEEEPEPVVEEPVETEKQSTDNTNEQ